MAGTSDFLIVGGGIAGISVGRELAADHSVTILEAEEQPGYHATGRSAAFFSAIYGNEVIRALTAASKDFFAAPPPGFAAQPLLQSCGCLVFGSPAQAQELAARHASLRHLSRGLALESAEFARARVPVLRTEVVGACLWEPDARRIDVHALLQGLLRDCRQRGGRLVTKARVEGASRQAGRWTVVTPAGEFAGRVLVNAAGAWADELAGLAGAACLGLTPLRRTACIVVTAPPADITGWPAVTDAQESFYFMPEGGQLLLSPADETPSPPGDAWADDMDVARAVDRLEAATTLTVRRVRQQWAGLRTFSADRSPVAGFDPQVEDFFWLAGQGGYGIQTAPAMARAAAALLRGREFPASLQAAGLHAAALAPERLQG